MGTNFYAIKVPTVSEHKQMEIALAHRQYAHLKDLLDESIKRYHIGKRSVGWQFCFEKQDYIIDKLSTLDQIKDFLSRKDIRIEDEYGAQYSADEFWKEISECLYQDDYHKNYTNGNYSCRFNEYITKDGLWVTEYEFC